MLRAGGGRRTRLEKGLINVTEAKEREGFTVVVSYFKCGVERKKEWLWVVIWS